MRILAALVTIAVAVYLVTHLDTQEAVLIGVGAVIVSFGLMAVGRRK